MTTAAASLLLLLCFCWLGGLMESDRLPPADPELPPLLPMTPTLLPGARLPTGLGDASEGACMAAAAEVRPRIPEAMLLAPEAEPSRPPDEDVGPPTVTLPLPMEPKVLLEAVVLMMPPREPGRPDPTAPTPAAWAYGAGLELDRRLAMVFRDACIPDRPRLPDMGLVVTEQEMPPLPSDRPRLRLLEVGGAPDSSGAWLPEVKSVLALGGEAAEEAGWLLTEATELQMDAEGAELTRFLAACGGGGGGGRADGWAGCWVALL